MAELRGKKVLYQEVKFEAWVEKVLIKVGMNVYWTLYLIALKSSVEGREVAFPGKNLFAKKWG